VGVDINTLHSYACKGDQQAVEELFEILSSRFRLFAHHKIRNKADVEEVVQEALMTIHAEYNNMAFRVSFSAWACKVLDYKILSYIQKRKRESKRIDRSSNRNTDSPKVRIETEPDLKRKLRECLQKICRRNLRYARILNLHYLGYQTGEICGKMDVKPETFYSALSKARSMLERCLEKGDVK
jgi:RNA polymerase sigma factor (sigma-70 family)